MPTKRPLSRLRDIVENDQAVLDYTKDLDFNGYVQGRLVRDGTERCLARLSEAKFGPLAEELFPEQDWLAMRNLGNVLRHDYNRVWIRSSGR